MQESESLKRKFSSELTHFSSCVRFPVYILNPDFIDLLTLFVKSVLK